MTGFASAETAATVDTVQKRSPYPLFTPIINQKPTVRIFLIYRTMFLLFPAKSGTNRKKTQSRLFWAKLEKKWSQGERRGTVAGGQLKPHTILQGLWFLPH